MKSIYCRPKSSDFSPYIDFQFSCKETEFRILTKYVTEPDSTHWKLKYLGLTTLIWMLRCINFFQGTPVMKKNLLHICGIHSMDSSSSTNKYIFFSFMFIMVTSNWTILTLFHKSTSYLECWRSICLESYSTILWYQKCC